MRDLQKQLLRSRLDIGGRCMPAKRELMHGLIASREIRCAVEIGVLRGSTFLVMAEAMEAAGRAGSRLYGIDPWHFEKARNHIPSANAAKAISLLFEDQAVWNEMHQNLLKILAEAQIEVPCCELIRAESTQVDHIHDVDLLHVDGNHDRAGEDLQHWLPRMSPGGVIVMDDCDWTAVSAAIDACLRPFARPLIDKPGMGWSVWEVA